ncbi:MAG: hypothetical protein AB7E85_02800 [Pseudobdellovibrionaceae bacterium]
MLRNLFDFSKHRKPHEAVLLYLFYVGCFVLISAVVQGQIG